MRERAAKGRQELEWERRERHRRVLLHSICDLGRRPTSSDMPHVSHPLDATSFHHKTHISCQESMGFSENARIREGQNTC